MTDAYRTFRSPEPAPVRWRLATRQGIVGWLALLPALSIVVVSSSASM